MQERDYIGVVRLVICAVHSWPKARVQRLKRIIMVNMVESLGGIDAGTTAWRWTKDNKEVF